MDRQRFSAIAHRDLALCNPVSAAKWDRVIELLGLPAGARVLDVGCGKAEVLARVVARYGATGVGVDRSAAFLAEARARFAAQDPAPDVALYEADAAAFPVEPGSFDLAMSVGASHALGGLSRTLVALARAARAGGGLVLVGEGYWKREPDPDYLAAFGGSRDELGTHAGNVDAGLAAGLAPLYSLTASEDDWDDYEGRYARAVELFATESPADPDAPAMLARIRAWRSAYLRWGRDTMGFGLYLFRT